MHVARAYQLIMFEDAGLIIFLFKSKANKFLYFHMHSYAHEMWNLIG